MADYQVTIHLTDNTDPNGPGNFNYAPGYLQVHQGDRVRFKCNRPFTVKFLYGSPFVTTGNNPVPVSGFFKNVASTTDYMVIDPNVELQPYHYIVSATDADGKITVDGGCPSIDVL